MKLDLKKVNIAMADNCLSTKLLSEKSGINYVTLVPYLNGRREPKPEILGKIANALGVDVTEIIE